MSGNGLEESFTVGKTTEVERASPAVLIEVGGKVIVANVISGSLVCL